MTTQIPGTEGKKVRCY